MTARRTTKNRGKNRGANSKIVKRAALTVIKPDKDAIQIGELYQKARLSLVESVRFAIACGQRLKAKQDSLPHGAWLPWLRDNAEVLGFDTPRTAQRLMALAANTTLASHLNEATAIARFGATIPIPIPKNLPRNRRTAATMSIWTACCATTKGN
jgi:hypothetical protein